jgi:hypothetical protein
MTPSDPMRGDMAHGTRLLSSARLPATLIVGLLKPVTSLVKLKLALREFFFSARRGGRPKTRWVFDYEYRVVVAQHVNGLRDCLLAIRGINPRH